jgi:hypothetical protein
VFAGSSKFYEVSKLAFFEVLGGGLKEDENSRFERNECEKQNQGPEKLLSEDFQKNRKNPVGVSAF